jgi:serine/threonine-protein kinase
MAAAYREATSGTFPAPGEAMSNTRETFLEPGETLPDTPAQRAVQSTEDTPRYGMLEPIGEGAMGVVLRVYDTLLDRTLAMKILQHWATRHETSCARFQDEARITARLQHPGIVGAQDFGTLSDGRMWFTMPEVHGRTLTDVLRDVHAASSAESWGESRGWSLRRLVDAWVRVCDTVAYAHQRAVVHRDLKPDNLMVGTFGEVFVMDWGIARLREASRPEEGEVRPTPGTQAGAVLGTPAYMPPEQARGDQDAVGPASDVYALAAVLYALLSARAPYAELGSARAVLRRLLERGPTPLAELPTPPLPAELVALVESGMAREPAGRPSATDLANAGRAWLDGVARRERALEAVVRADALVPRIEALRAEAASLRTEAAALLTPIPAHAPAADKQPGWDLEDRAAQVGRAADLDQIAWRTAIQGALDLVPELPEARARLADHYRDRLVRAERDGVEDEAARCEAMLRAWDDGRHAAFLEGTGALTLHTDPPGAEAVLHRFVRRGRRLVPERVRSLGRTPLDAVELPHGSWLVVLSLPDRPPVRYPVAIGRQAHWDGVRPGGRAAFPVRIPEEPGEPYVPAGWTCSGGDRDAAEALSSRRLWVDGFRLQRNPVTLEAYARFLDALDGAGREACAPRLRSPDPVLGDRLLVFEGGRHRPSGLVDGVRYHPDSPVTFVSQVAATTYAAWFAAETGEDWRLPHDQEWEKAARGVDGRCFPWGSHAEPSWFCHLPSHAGEPRGVPATAYPDDLSSYGVHGLAGNVRDWCGNAYDREGPPDGSLVSACFADEATHRMIRGGSWGSNPWFCRAASRFAGPPGMAFPVVSFRLACAVR